MVQGSLVPSVKKNAERQIYFEGTEYEEWKKMMIKRFISLLMVFALLAGSIPAYADVAVDPFDEWKIPNNNVSGVVYDLYGITYGDGKYVAVGASGAIVTSSDGESWKRQNSTTTKTLQGVAYGSDGFVAVGGNGTIVTSKDGEIWNSVTGFTTTLMGVTFGDGKYVAVGLNGKIVILTFTNNTWGLETHTINFATLRSIIYGNGKFVAVGSYKDFEPLSSAFGNIWTFSVGATWVSPTSPANPTSVITTASVGGITYNNGKYVAVGAKGTIVTSSDGATWGSLKKGTLDLSGVTYGNGKYVAVGASGTIVSSSDGVSWTSGTSGTTKLLYGIASDGNGKYVAVGATGTILQSSVAATNLPAQTVNGTAASRTPEVGGDNAITLSVKNSLGDTDTSFTGAHDMTISGYEQAPDNSYGSFDGTPLTVSPNTIRVSFASGVATANLKLNKAASQTISLSVPGVATPAANTLSITPVAGSAVSLAMTTDITAPASNGVAFMQQPVVILLDGHGNTSVGDSTTVVTVSKKDSGEWVLTGTATQTASAGVATFANLGATSTVEVTGAQLSFNAPGLTQKTSADVILPAPAPAQTVSAFATSPEAGVDSTITLIVKNSLGNTDTTFTGAHNVTLSGYIQAFDSSYGSFNGTILTSSPNTIRVTFMSGEATAILKLNKVAAQTISFSVAGVATPAANTLSIAPIAVKPTVTTKPIELDEVTSSTVTAGGDVTNDGGDPITERGIAYSTSMNPTVSGKKIAAAGTTGSFTVNLSGLSANTLYHYRAYAKNLQGISYGDDSQFSTNVKYGNVGPSIINAQDPHVLQLTGEGFSANSSAEFTMYLKGEDSSSYPILAAGIQYKLAKPKQLTLVLPSGLPIGSYDLYIEHTSFDSKTFVDAVTITNKYDKVVVSNPNYDAKDKKSKDQVEKIFLEGHFVKEDQNKPVYTLEYTDQVVSINDNLYFKGTSLTVDKTNLDIETITGNGQLYIKVEKSTEMNKKTKKKKVHYTNITIRDGQFKFDTSNFKFKMTDLAHDLADKANYLGIDAPNLPIEIKSFTFIPGGIRLTGTMEIVIGAGATSIKGNADIAALDFKGTKVDLKGDFKVGAEFKNGPFENAAVNFGVDTKNKEYSFGATVLLRKTQVGFDTDFTLKNKKLDSMKFVIFAEVKIPDTNMQFTSFGGKAEHLVNPPVVYHALTSLSDYTSAKINGKNMINIEDIDLTLYEDHIEGTGDMKFYNIHVADLILGLYTQKMTKQLTGNALKKAKDKGTHLEGGDKIVLHRPGMELEGIVDVADKGVIVGDVSMKGTEDGVSGHVDAKVKIPKNVKYIGNKTVGEAEIDFNKVRLKAGLKVAQVPFTLQYKFKDKKMNFKLDMKAVGKLIKKGIIKTGKKIKKGLKKVGKAISGLFSMNSLNDKGRVMILSAGQANNQTEIIGGKLFDQMDMQPTARGKVIPGYATTLVTETNPVVTVEKSGLKPTANSDTVELVKGVTTLHVKGESAKLLIVDHSKSTDGQQYPDGIKLLRPDGTVLNWQAGYYDEANRRIYVNLPAGSAGDWTLVSALDMHAELYDVPAETKLQDVIAYAHNKANQVTHSIQISAMYPGLVMLNNASADTQILQPNGEKYELRYKAAQSKAANAVYDEKSHTLIAEVDFNQAGTWKFQSNDTMGLEIHKMMFRNPNVSIGELADKLSSAAYTLFVPLDFNKNGMKLIEIQNAKVDSVLIKPDGRVYASETDAANPAWNTFGEEGSDTLNIVAEVAQTGTWLVDAGEDAQVSLYDIQGNVSMSKLEAWKEAPEMGTPIDFSESKGEQVWTEISYASPATKLFKSDGTEYKLVLDSNDPNWNAKYDEVTEIMSVLIDVDVEGIWIVKSNDFTDISMLVYDSPISMAELNDSQAEYTSFLDMDEKGTFSFDIAGGKENTQIIAPDGKAVSIISDESNPKWNAILNKEDNSLKVTVNVDQTGEWQIYSIGPVTVNLYKLAPMPEVDKFQASKAPGLNRYELSWNVINPKEDTKVRVVLTDSPDKMLGEEIAIDLPASGVRTISLPEGLLPKHYHLVLVADSESFGPIFKVLDQPIEVTALRKLPQPQAVTVVSTGDGVIELAFKDANWQDVTSYRVFATDVREDGANSGGTVDVIPAGQEQQKAIIGNLEPGVSYNLSVMVFNETEESMLVSDPTADVKVDLPVPVPAKLTAELDVSGAARVDYLYMPEDLTGLTTEEQEALQEKITVSSASQVAVNITSDQDARIELFVNGESVGVKDATTTTPASFSLENLSERDYTLVAKAVNARGDRSSYEQLLFIDRTAPYLSVSNAVYGQVMDGSRVKLMGTSEPGVGLTINDASVPVDQYGSFAYVVQFPKDGVLPLLIVAQDELGNKTEQAMEIVQGEAGEPGDPADLATLVMDEGVMSSSFDSNVQEYSVAIEASTKEVLVWAVPVEKNAVVTINGTMTDEDHSAMIQLPSESSRITVVVKAADLSSKTYTLEFKPTSSLAALSNVTLNWDENEVKGSLKPQLSPSFSSLKDAYRVVVANNVTHTSLIPTSAVTGSLIKVNGNDTLDGQAAANIPLIVGDNTISIQVLSLDESNNPGARDWTLAKTYTITVTREASSVAELKILSITDGKLTPDVFDTAVDYYKTTVAPNVNRVKLHMEAIDAASVEKVNDLLVDASGNIQLNLVQGMNTFRISVIAANGATKTYTIEVFKQTAVTSLLNLKSLSIAGDELDKEFSPWQLNYSTRTGKSNSSILNIKAVPVEPTTVVSVNGVKVNELGSASIHLLNGDNTLLIKVETQNGLESKTYALRTTYAEVHTSQPTDSTNNTSKPIDSSTNTSESTVSSNPFQAAINGLENSRITIMNEEKEGEKSSIHVIFQPDEFEKALSNLQDKPTISIPVAASPDKLVIELTGEMIKMLGEKDAILDFHTNQVSYILPTSSMNIAEIGRKFGPDVQLKDVVVQVLMTMPSNEARQAIEQSASGIQATVVASPMDFQVVYNYKDQVLDAERFTQYVERSIILPDTTDAQALTTGVRVSEDGSFYHVPTYVTEKDGHYWAHMKSYTNSTYALISRNKTFVDINRHWSQTAVEDLASRLVIEGKSLNRFEPDQSVTRGEFTAMAMRSLGISPKSSSLPYQDVSVTDWYGPIIAEASAQGLITGYKDQSFRPNQAITRAEATVILSKAWLLAGKKLPGAEDIATALQGIKDQANVKAWAQSSMATAVHLKLMQGYEDGTIRPASQITRAEVATLLRKMLLQSNLIQP